MNSELIPLRRRGAPDASGPAAVGPITRRVFIETYGCQMNIGDSELMAGALAQHGYLQVSEPCDADVILINTCAIREHAERRVLGRIGQLQALRRANPDLVVGLTGCMAQRMGTSLLEEGRGVDLVAGPDGYRRLGTLVEEIRFGDRPRGQQLLEFDGAENYEGLPSLRRRGVSAWITVQRGCDHRCTFCIVPYVRGAEKNRTPAAILEEVRGVAEEGFTEVTLLGQTVNSYRSLDWDFARLLRAVARVEGVRRVRFTSPHPNDVSDRLVAVMAEEESVCPQLHLPVQSGSNRVLRRMVRRYTAEKFLDTVEHVRREVPGVALSTDVIVGFPGETEADFEATLALLREIRFDDAYLYRYSLREGTPAARMPNADFVAADEAAARLERTIALHRSIQREINQSEVGSVSEVLVERQARSAGDVLGRTARNKVVAFPGAPAWIGTYLPVRLIGTSGSTFTGRRAS